MHPGLAFLFIAALLGRPAQAGDGVLRFVAPENLSMPLAAFHDGQLTDGIIKDLGQAIAERLGRRAVFITIPSKRAQKFLAAGGADGLCYISKLWADGLYDWTSPMIPDATLLVARADAPVITDFQQLAGQAVATTMGYRYAKAEQTLGPGLVRDDAPSVDLDLQKLARGRVRYALVNKLAYDYETRTHPEWHLRQDLSFDPISAACAFSLKSPVPFREVGAAVDALIAEGRVSAILEKYR